MIHGCLRREGFELVVHGEQAVLLISILFHGHGTPARAYRLLQGPRSDSIAPLPPAVYGVCSVDGSVSRYLLGTG